MHLVANCISSIDTVTSRAASSAATAISFVSLGVSACIKHGCVQGAVQLLCAMDSPSEQFVKDSATLQIVLRMLAHCTELREGCSQFLGCGKESLLKILDLTSSDVMETRALALRVLARLAEFSQSEKASLVDEEELECQTVTSCISTIELIADSTINGENMDVLVTSAANAICVLAALLQPSLVSQLRQEGPLRA